jgi:hypothetical protein
MSNYDQDFYGWTQQQAALLKAGRLNDLDIANLIEEVETMGRSEKHELQSRLTLLLTHLLKWQHLPHTRSKNERLNIEVYRDHYFEVLTENPSLNPLLPDILGNAYRLAKINAAQETELDTHVFASECPWTLEQITDDNFFPD